MDAQKAFEKNFGITVQELHSSEEKYSIKEIWRCWHAAWKARGLLDANICDERRASRAFEETYEFYNDACEDCAEAIRKVDV